MTPQGRARPEKTNEKLPLFRSDFLVIITWKNLLLAGYFAAAAAAGAGVPPTYLATTSSMDGRALSLKSSDIFSFLPLVPESEKSPQLKT